MLVVFTSVAIILSWISVNITGIIAHKMLEENGPIKKYLYFMLDVWEYHFRPLSHSHELYLYLCLRLGPMCSLVKLKPRWMLALKSGVFLNKTIQGSENYLHPRYLKKRSKFCPIPKANIALFRYLEKSKKKCLVSLDWNGCTSETFRIHLLSSNYVLFFCSIMIFQDWSVNYPMPT